MRSNGHKQGKVERHHTAKWTRNGEQTAAQLREYGNISESRAAWEKRFHKAAVEVERKRLIREQEEMDVLRITKRLLGNLNPHNGE